MTRPLKLAQIGFGGIGLTVAELLGEDEDFEYVAAAARPHRADAIRERLGAVPLVDTPDAVIAAEPDILIECASHQALLDYGAPILEAGIDLVAVSVGALADQNERLLLIAAAEKGDASLEVPAGAIGGLDVVSAARHTGIERLAYVTRKAPRLWKGTPAEDMIDLDAVTDPLMFFDETAAEGARIFEEKLNVAATLAMAGVGFEQTRVELWADPAYPRSTHIIELEAASGTMKIELANTVTPVNDKSSWLTAASIAQAVKRRRALLKF
ncbi:MAG TPA: aspartate dehydrogenase [Rhodospirillaceae bacterium]|nr:aspartate dehydrogenase [Rhodospirillaceae bacterium]HAT34165.1 aspartate dehydrogenase [Rhodospirillaceae bacterium]